jgi:hypothetical protein
MRAFKTFCKIIAAIVASLFLFVLAIAVFGEHSPEYIARRAAEAEAAATAAKAKADARAEAEAAAAKIKAEAEAAAAKIKAEAEAAPNAAPKPGEEVTDKYFERVRSKALIPCSRAIEEASEHDLRWSSNFWLVIDRFTVWNKYQHADGHVILGGDQAEEQNAYGNWVRVHYLCEYDPVADKVIRTEISPGRLRVKG